ncbi:hypothetical protein GALL_479260 [mine drainage metagenome]|uniref:Uncharacterized protein n=1 Tax=mine drainage metagenome TaxID=410659 RepID=A0A1J5PI57_9ZZZZ
MHVVGPEQHDGPVPGAAVGVAIEGLAMAAEVCRIEARHELEGCVVDFSGPPHGVQRVDRQIARIAAAGIVEGRAKQDVPLARDAFVVPDVTAFVEGLRPGGQVFHNESFQVVPPRSAAAIA